MNQTERVRHASRHQASSSRSKSAGEMCDGRSIATWLMAGGDMMDQRATVRMHHGQNRFGEKQAPSSHRRLLLDELAFKKCVRRENWDPPKRMKNLEIAIPAYEDVGVSANCNLQKRIVVWIATQ